jgi:hypothetical protein
MSLEVFGDGGDGEDLGELAAKYNYSQGADNLWREKDCADEPGLTDEQMWEYIWDRQESDLEDMAVNSLYYEGDA